MVFIESILFLSGIGILVRSSDVFVESAAKLAKLFGVSAFVIGLTVVAVGTSVPELATSINASLKGSSGIILGTIIGSNIANIGLILALAVFLGGAIKVERKIFDKDLFVMIVASVIFAYFLADGLLSFSEGAFLLLSFLAYAFFLFKQDFEFQKIFHFKSYLKSFYGLGSFLFNVSIYREIIKQGLDPKTYSAFIKENPVGFEGEFGKNLNPSDKKKFKEEYRKQLVSRIVKNFLLLFFGFVGVWAGSELTVREAIYLANFFGIQSEIIGFTVVAVGTSLPELSVSLSSIKKGFPSILLGNIVGSNIANILLIGGAASIIHAVFSPQELILAPLMVMLSLSLLMWLSVYRSWKINHFFAALFFLCYLAFLYLVLSRNFASA